MKISARFFLGGGGGYIRARAIYERGIYTDCFDISGEILQKISKTLFQAQHWEKKTPYFQQ